MISLITPNYNGEKWLNECLDSVASQTLSQQEIEMIFIDDGSDDSSAEIVQSYQRDIPGLRPIWHEHCGRPGELRNVGIQKAVGEYVLFLDADDYLGNESLEKLSAFTQDTPADIVAFQLDGRDRKVPRSMLKETIEDADIITSGLYKSLGVWKMCRRNFLNENSIEFSTLERGEDVLFFTEALLRASSVSILSDYPFYTIRGREDGTSITQSKWVNAERIEFVKKMAQTVLKHSPGSDTTNHFLVRAFNTDALAILESTDTTQEELVYLKDSLGEYWNDAIKNLIYTDKNREILQQFFERGSL